MVNHKTLTPLTIAHLRYAFCICYFHSDKKVCDTSDERSAVVIGWCLRITCLC